MKAPGREPLAGGNGRELTQTGPLLTVLPSEMLEMIISHLTLTDLKSLRLASRKTNRFTTIYILKRDICAIQFVFDPVKKLFIHNKRVGESDDLLKNQFQLTSLTSCMESSSNFPCTNFQFSGGYLKKGTDVETFFLSQRGRIKGLSVWFSRGEGREKGAAVLESLQLLSNLENLDFGGEMTNGRNSVPPTPTPQQQSVEGAPRLVLEKLKFLTLKPSISISNNVAFITNLLAVAPNLEAGDVALCPGNIRYVDLFISHKKIHLINEMTFEPSQDGENLDDYAKFAEAISTLPSHLQKLSQLVIFPNLIPKGETQLLEKAAKILTRILTFCGASLKSLVINVPTGFLRFMKAWGRLKSVKFLATYFQQFSTELEDYLMFPMITFDLNETFPALVSVSLAGLPSFNESEQAEVAAIESMYFPFSLGTFGRVQRLHLMLNLPSSWLTNFPRVFPNVMCVLVNEIQNFEQMSQVIWNWNFPNLTIMELEICVGDQFYEVNCFPSLDAAFTGFCKQTCRQMEQQVKQNGGVSQDLQVDTLRVRPSILKLHELRDLKIAFKDQDDRVKDAYHLLNGFIAGEFALKFMPWLRTSILVTAKVDSNIQRMQESLQSLSSYCYVGALGNPIEFDC